MELFSLTFVMITDHFFDFENRIQKYLPIAILKIFCQHFDAYTNRSFHSPVKSTHLHFENGNNNLINTFTSSMFRENC